jgi:hypothetical protein
MLNIDCLNFDTPGWDVVKSSDSKVTWTNAQGDRLGKQFFPLPPDIPSLYALEELRDYFRKQALQSGGAIISVDVLHLKGMSLARSIFKYPRPSGMGFFGSLIMPFRDFSYVIRVQCVESQDTINREATLLPRVQEQLPAGTVLADVWLQDPYDPTFRGPVLRCLSDDECWDCELPEHPLSKIRSIFAQIIPSITVDREVKNSVPFRGAQP